MTHINYLLAMGQTPSGTQSTAPGWVGMIPLVLMMVVFYFILIRPQQKKAKDHEKMLTTIKPGDKVIAAGGMVSVVVSVKEKSLVIRSGDAKFEILKSAVSDITERGGDNSAS
jgi:preprotein translocase subunit YajC